MAGCCPCCLAGVSGGGGGRPAASGPKMPVMCLVPRDELANSAGGGAGRSQPGPGPAASSTAQSSEFQLLSEDYIRKHFKLPQPAMYLDAFKRPLITFPLGQENNQYFNIAKKNKINQMILDGKLDPSAAICAPSVFPFGKSEHEKREKAKDDEIIYILQLPDHEFVCPTHKQTIRTPRFIWHSCKKGDKKDSAEGGAKQGGGPLNRPKPWLLSRHTDFDMMSQW